MNFKLRFWGVRGSYPATGGDFDLGGNTTCLEVEVGKHTLIFDAGTGIIRLGKYLSNISAQKKQSEFLLFFTHYHQDHVQGLPFFPLLYQPQIKIHFFGPNQGNRSLFENLQMNMYMPFFPVRFEDTLSKKEFIDLCELDVIEFNPRDEKLNFNRSETYQEVGKSEPDLVKITACKNHIHPKGGDFYYKIEYQGKKVIFATDVEGYVGGDRRLIRHAEGADVLIHDAQYLPEVYLHPVMPTQGFGHATPEIAAEVAREAKVKRLVLTHHDPWSDNEKVREAEALAKAIFPESYHAYEVMEIDVIKNTVSQFTGL